MADGASFQINLPVSGAAGVQAAADHLDRLSASLGVATKAAADTSAAVQAGELAYKEAEKTYDKASKALEKINVSMATASGKTLTNLIARQAEASKAVDGAKLAFDGESTALDKLRTSAAAADAKVDHLAKSQADAKKSLDAQKKSQADSFAANELLASSLGKLGGPLGAAGQKAFELRGAWDKMSKALGAAGPYAAIAVVFVAVAAALATVAIAAAVGVAQIGAWAVGLADAARSQGLLAAGIARSVSGGEKLNESIGSLSQRVPQTSDELTSMAAELAKTGLRGEALTTTLEKNAIAAAKLKFGPEWEKQMLSLGVQQRKFKDGLNGLFSGLKIDSLLEGLSTLVGLFDENNASGKAIKVVFESVFQPLVDGASGMVPAIRHAFLQFEILSLKALIAIKPWGSTFVKIGQVIAVVAGVMLGIFAAAIGVVIGLAATLAAVIVLPIALFAALAAGVIYLGVALIDAGAKFVTGIVAGISSAWKSVTEFGALLLDVFANISLVDVGAKLIDGLVAGITSGVAAVGAAAESAAMGAVNAAKKALGIASPSKIFAEIGAFTGAGMEQGLEKSSGGVEAAMTDLVAPPAPRGGGGASEASSSSSSSSNVFNIVIQGGGAEDIAEKVRQIILDTIEGASIQVGAGVA